MPTRPPILLPVPRQVELSSDVVTVEKSSRWNVDCSDARIPTAIHSLPAQTTQLSSAPTVPVTVRVDSSLALPADGYRIIVKPAGVTLTGRTSAACFHGLQTLSQMTDPRTREVPCGTISDWPDFATRGLLFDVTRGRVPTLPTLQRLVDRLVALKINQLQLNIEHSFVFSFDPEICGADEGLTPDEVRNLDDYCRARFITLVPALANLGHMGRILSLPRYRHLAEVPATTDWEVMPWPQRLRGCTLDAANPEAWTLVQRMWSDILAAFSSPVVNICGDEPWDLGAGKNKERCLRDGKSDLYLGHLRRVQDFCAQHGRTTQFWGDVVRNYPQLLHRLRPDGAILHWGYDDRSDYAATATFVSSGLPTIVCPGTSGWKRTLNAINLADRNIRTFAEAGKRAGAVGLVNTDWGDHGHFNLPASSSHGIALGAALGWRADHPTGDPFDRMFAHQAWGLADPSFGPLLRSAARISDECETWRILWMDARTVSPEATLPNPDRALAAQHAAEAFAAFAQQQATTARAEAPKSCAPNDWMELALAAEFTALAAEKVALLHALRIADTDLSPLRRRCHAWSDRLQAAGIRFAQMWHGRHKPLRLPDIAAAIARAATDLRTFSP